MLTVSQPEQTVAADAESVSFTYVAKNITGEITSVEGTDANNIISAVNVDKASSTVNVTLNPNTEDVEKTATIILSADGVEPIILTVTQKGYIAAGTVITDILTTTGFNAGASYKNLTYTAESGAEYAGRLMKENQKNSVSIQLNSKDNIGIITKVSAGKTSNVEVVWDNNTTNGRTLDIYGSNEPYTGTDASALYDTSTQGELLGSIVYGQTTELTISGDYQYIGLRSKSGAMYLEEIRITWEK